MGANPYRKNAPIYLKNAPIVKWYQNFRLLTGKDQDENLGLYFLLSQGLYLDRKRDSSQAGLRLLDRSCLGLFFEPVYIFFKKS